MLVELSPEEARVVGALLEKEITTPEQYPLSLNALVNACNQKSNREPVMNLSEQQVQALVDTLVKRHLLTDRSGFGSRVTKYQQRFCNTEFSELQFSAQERALITLLLLRGPQTPGELRSRSGRLHSFGDVGEVEDTLRQLMSREDGPFVSRLAREPGRRETRYAQRFTGEVETAAESMPAKSDESLQSLRARLERVEREVTALRAALDAIATTAE